MKRNMGKGDSTIRAIVAVLFAVLYFTKTITGTWGILLMVLAFVFAATSFVNFCPMYVPFN
ncbi:MAG: DUF2892 domain-containing protein, partial [Bacteroidota bacterium]